MPNTLEDSRPAWFRIMPGISAVLAIVISVGSVLWAAAARARTEEINNDWHEKRITALEKSLETMSVNFQSLRDKLVQDQRVNDKSVADLDRKLDVLLTRFDEYTRKAESK